MRCSVEAPAFFVRIVIEPQGMEALRLCEDVLVALFAELRDEPFSSLGLRVRLVRLSLDHFVELLEDLACDLLRSVEINHRHEIGRGQRTGFRRSVGASHFVVQAFFCEVLQTMVDLVHRVDLEPIGHVEDAFQVGLPRDASAVGEGLLIAVDEHRCRHVVVRQLALVRMLVFQLL